jgi:hypothetical protein
VAIPGSLESIAAANNLTIDYNTTEIFIVTEPGKLEDTIGAASFNSNTTTVVVLGPGVYPQAGTYTLTSNIYILVDSTGGAPARRRLLLNAPTTHHRHLLTLDRAIIYARSDNRHFTMSNASIFTDGVIFEGSSTTYYSGGVVLENQATGFFYNTTFHHCHTQGNGGALLLTDGSSCTLEASSECIDNEAAQGGAIYAGVDCTVTLNSTTRFFNNSAPRTSASTGGGGAIYLADSSTSLVIDGNVLFDGNVGDDITVAADGIVTCANTAYAPSIDCTTGCTGSYAVPLACPICSSSIAGNCTACPQGTYGGAGVALACKLCAYGFTTIYPPSSTSAADCVPITEPPTVQPTQQPTLTPTTRPTQLPSQTPTQRPTTRAPSVTPSRVPTQPPTLTFSPTQRPTTARPTTTPSLQPSALPTTLPSASPSSSPSSTPTLVPSGSPTAGPSALPTALPSASPSSSPSSTPTLVPSASPTTGAPTETPSLSPTQAPTAWPFVRNITVLRLFNGTGVEDTWTTDFTRSGAKTVLMDLSPTTYVSFVTGVSPIPTNLDLDGGGYQTAVLQQTPTGSENNARSLIDIHYSSGLFNG